MELVNNRQSVFLEKIGNIFTGWSTDVNQLISGVFNLIITHFNIEKGTITIYDQCNGGVIASVSHGYSINELSGITGSPGKNITSAIAKTGNPYVIIDIMNEPEYLNITGVDRRNYGNKISFICVPVKINLSVIGAISVDIINNYGRDLSEEYQALTTASIMIAQAVSKTPESCSRHADGTFEERTALFEKSLITDALLVSKGNISDAARKLGTTKRIIGYKIEKFGIDCKSFKTGRYK